MERYRGLIVAAAVLAWSAGARAEDWPQWRGPERTGHAAPGAKAPAGLADVKVLWHVPVGNGLASPVVAGGRVFYLDNRDEQETVHAADAATGRAIWSAPLDEAFKDSQSPAGPRCTPVVDGDRVYAQSCRGELRCLSAADGKVLWRTNFVKDFGAVFIGEKGKAEGATRHGYNGSPVVEGPMLIAQVGGKPGACLVAFEKTTGKVIWKSQDDTPGYAAPVVATIHGVRQVVSFTAEGVIGVAVADGRLLWREPVKTALARHVTTPVVVEDVVVVSSHQAGLIGVRVSKQGDGFSAKRAWEDKTLAINFASSVAVDRHLYGVGPQKNLMCVDVRTGKRSWSKDGLFGGNAGSAHAGIVAVGSNLLALTDRGELVLIAAEPARYTELGRAQVCGTTWCNPAYANGRVYLRDGRELYCVEVAR